MIRSRGKSGERMRVPRGWEPGSREQRVRLPAERGLSGGCLVSHQAFQAAQMFLLLPLYIVATNPSLYLRKPEHRSIL